MDVHLHRQDVDESKQAACGSSGVIIPRRLLAAVLGEGARTVPANALHGISMVLHAFDRVDADLAT